MLFLFGLVVYLKFQFNKAILIQTIVVGIATVVVWHTESNLNRKLGLPYFNQIFSWSTLFSSLFLSLFSEASSYGEKIIGIFLSFAAPFILLSISYEVIFYCCIGAILFLWIWIENQTTKTQGPSTIGKQNLQNVILYVSFIH